MRLTTRLPRRLVCVGQLTSDATVLLDSLLAIGDQTTGAITRGFGGTAAIVAHNAALLGLTPVSFAGHAGADAAGRDGLARLTATGVQIGPLVETPASPEVLVLVDPGGERTMVASAGAPDWRDLQLQPSPDDIVVFEGWHLFGEDARDYCELVRRARQAGAMIAVDVCSAARAEDPRCHGELLAGLHPDVLLANAAEAAVFGLEPWGEETTLVVHSGSGPTRVWTGGRVASFAVRAREPLDTTGAGDTFAAGFLSALAVGQSIADAVALAHLAAGEVVATPGPLLVSHVALPTR